MGLTMVLAPTTGTVLYELGGSVPVIAGAVVTGLVAVGATVSPRLRAATSPEEPETTPAA